MELSISSFSQRSSSAGDLDLGAGAMLILSPLGTIPVFFLTV